MSNEMNNNLKIKDYSGFASVRSLYRASKVVGGKYAGHMTVAANYTVSADVGVEMGYVTQ